MQILSIKQTCFAIPSAWQGELSDHTFFYVRYRQGKLKFCISIHSEDDAVWEKPVKELRLEEGGGGIISTAKMLEWLNLQLDEKRLAELTAAEDLFHADQRV